ncbi:MAG: hypothetical protein HUJ31_17160 [Pseudomonadales bacterium]|nr:hypothetical protein [Pseudomonadales bacterium]
MKRRWLLVCLLITLTGCNSMRWQQTVDAWMRAGPLELVEQMSELDTPEERNRLAGAVQAELQQNSTDENILRLAIVRSLPGHYLSSDAEALVLLESLNEDALRESSRRIAHWLGPNLKYRLALRESNEDLQDELQSTQSALKRAREKIEILTRIERTMGPNPEVE